MFATEFIKFAAVLLLTLLLLRADNGRAADEINFQLETSNLQQQPQQKSFVTYTFVQPQQQQRQQYPQQTPYHQQQQQQQPQYQQYPQQQQFDGITSLHFVAVPNQQSTPQTLTDVVVNNLPTIEPSQNPYQPIGQQQPQQNYQQKYVFAAPQQFTTQQKTQQYPATTTQQQHIHIPATQQQQQYYQQVPQQHANAQFFYQQPLSQQHHQQQQQHHLLYHNQQPVNTNELRPSSNSMRFSPLLPTHITDPTEFTNITIACAVCCNPLEDPCTRCCSTPLLSHNVLKTAAG